MRPGVGDTATVVHTCALHSEPVEGAFVVEDVERMSATGEWRITATRCDGTPIRWYVR